MAVSGFPPSDGVEDDSIFDATGFGASTVFASDLTGVGSSVSISASFTAFALSNNPPIVHPRYHPVAVMGL